MAVPDRLSLFCRDRMTVGSYYNIRVIYYECGFMNIVQQSKRVFKRGSFIEHVRMENIIYYEWWL